MLCLLHLALSVRVHFFGASGLPENTPAWRSRSTTRKIAVRDHAPQVTPSSHLPIRIHELVNITTPVGNGLFANLHAYILCGRIVRAIREYVRFFGSPRSATVTRWRAPLIGPHMITYSRGAPLVPVPLRLQMHSAAKTRAQMFGGGLMTLTAMKPIRSDLCKTFDAAVEEATGVPCVRPRR